MDDIKKTVTNLNVVKSEKKEFNWKDPLDLDGQLSEEEKLIRDTAYDYAQGSLLPRVEEAFLEENTDVKIFKEMGEESLAELIKIMQMWWENEFIPPEVLRAHSVNI